jgi:hypothetical protein
VCCFVVVVVGVVGRYCFSRIVPREFITTSPTHNNRRTRIVSVPEEEVEEEDADGDDEEEDGPVFGPRIPPPLPLAMVALHSKGLKLSLTFF